jgi:hypothetical protein
MPFHKPLVGLIAATALSGCFLADAPADKSQARNTFARKDLSPLKAGVWIDPNGCDHWIIDDGVEGYLSQRLDKYGKPVCSGTAPPTVATGDFKNGSTSLIGDPI